ncbi:MAG TPA: proline--tRNA ligase [Bacillota bacterium]|jgi:prolyl-tRNA synthetase|nr:proline--tRNA ligase [Peptococcaceae bacterium MAG4]NLW38498.1 proline--tRNA ligase [Peptococcaceae bacterium]HPU35226.1 proline--tRNA ligase [Bacillota bacterium]HPZ42451.1 proline--tRNA ligase [Bacillota bacterium]HQD75243.1 proline--tRNA ligase [Bacillota bacterium]
MRATEFFAPTLREVPAEAEVVSHQLLLRAGFIRRTAAGIYTYLPLALRVLKKIKQIIREEMDRQGGQEILMPIIQPAELWQESGRWDVYGPELFRLKDRHERSFALGPTHEEIVTVLVRGEVNSYKQLPLLLYQIQNKYRDERRPRFGLMRGREFIMKDLYSFDRDEKGLHVSYMKMYEAYQRIFQRCGLTFRPVEADSGAIGGSDTHEFMVLAESGEATVLYCQDTKCDYASNVEKAAQVVREAGAKEDLKPLMEKETPGCRTIEEVSRFLGIPPQKMIKTLLYETEKEVVAALVRGDREINETKLLNTLGCIRLEMAGADTVLRVSGAPIGFAGPVGLKNCKIIADPEVVQITNAVTGANKNNYHLLNVNIQRDYHVHTVSDIRMVQAGEPCPRCGSPLVEAKGIEVGQIFKLGDKYSKVLGANYLDENGRSQPIIMGCYGIGVTRTMAAAIEQNHDKDGIIWPASIAPFDAVIIPVSTKDEAQVNLAEEIYNKLSAAGFDVLLDDRPERVGVKFKDADLIGYPLRLTVGSRTAAERQVEVRVRKTGEVTITSMNELEKRVRELLATI